MISNHTGFKQGRHQHQIRSKKHENVVRVETRPPCHMLGLVGKVSTRMIFKSMV
jgi:hypothetical protein